jgi:hypothetical protein
VIVPLLIVLHVLRVVHRVTVRVVVVGRHALIGLWQVFVVLGILVVYALVGLLVRLGRHALGRNMGGVHLHGRRRIRIGVGVHPGVHFPLRSLVSLSHVLSPKSLVIGSRAPRTRRGPF